MAFAGLVIIIFFMLISFFAYIIAPDNTPNADLQTVEIQAKKTGYTQLFLKIPDKKIHQTNWLTRFFNGTPSQYKYLPITGYSMSGNDLLVK